MRLRRVLSLWAVIALSLFLIVAAAGPGAALGRDTIVVKQGQPVERSYPPLAGNDPNPVLTTPDQCRSAPSCDTIPLVIEVPTGLGVSDDFYVRLTLIWNDGGKVNGQQANDMDLRLYYKTTNIARAKTADQPEVLLVYRPVDKDYAVTVLNYTGPNTGYSLRAEMLTESVGAPGEFQEPSGPPPDLSEGSEPPSSSSISAAPASPPTGGEALAGPVATADEALLKLGQSSGQLSKFLGASGDLQNLGQQESAPPKPVTPTQVVLWAGVFPITLVAAGGAWLKFRSAARLGAV
jgi:hypothetical protein